MSDIILVDVSARDGLQNEPGAAALSAEDKVAFIIALARCGLKRIEAGSFVKPSAVPAMANSEEVGHLLAPVQREFPSVIFSYLVPNIKGLERAKAVGAKEVAIFLALSEAFSKANINQTVDESYTAIAPTIDAARAENIRVRGYISNVFGYSDLPFVPKEVARRSKQLLEMGCYEVSLGDTTGIGTPAQVADVISALKDAGVPLDSIALHFHDTFGKAIGNVERAYDLGIRTFDAATGGLGGCPYANSPKGNLAMEDLLAWCAKRGITTDVNDAEALKRTGQLMLNKLGKTGGSA